MSINVSSKEDIVATYYIDCKEEKDKLNKTLKYGSKVTLNGILVKPSNNTLPNTFNYKKYLNNKGIYYTLKVEDVSINNDNIPLLYKIKNVINKRISNIDQKGYMKAFILGDTKLIDNDIFSIYQNIGITHLFAISGMHVSLLSGLLLKLFKKINVLSKYIIVDSILIIYGALIGFPASIKRCILFFILNSFSKIFKVEVSSLKILYLVIFIILIMDYRSIYDIGFMYSICTVLGIIISDKFINNGSYIVRSLKMSLIAFLFSLPISLYNFYEINLLSIIYNLFYIPYISFVVYPLSIVSFICPFMYKLFSVSVLLMEISSSFFSSIKLFTLYLNFNMFEVILFYSILIILIYKFYYKGFIILFIMVLIDLVLPFLDSNAYVYFFDVGQGDSSLIISSYRKDVILIDTGGILGYKSEDWKEREEYEVSDNVVSFMKSKGIKNLSSLILSHGDYDHMGEALNIVENFKVKKVIFDNGEYNDLELELINVLEKKNIPYYQNIKEFDIGDKKLYFLNNKVYDNENDNSIVLYTQINNKKLLLMGDAGIDVEEDLIKKYNLSDIDILKVGHHGSKTSSSNEFINCIEPKYSIISLGKNNRYGHPNDEVLEILNDSKIYRTDKDGSIMFKFNKNKLAVSVCPP